MLNPRRYSLMETMHDGGYGHYLSTPWTKTRAPNSSPPVPISAITQTDSNIVPTTIQQTKGAIMGNTEHSKSFPSKDLTALSDLFSKTINLSENEEMDYIPPIPDSVGLEQHLPAICSNIYRILSSRQLEATYQNCLAADLKEAGVAVHSEVSINLLYKGRRVGSRQADLIVQTKDKEITILELKAVPQNKLSRDHLKQLQFYMHHFGVKNGYLINFPHDYGFPDVAEYVENTNSEFRHEIIYGRLFDVVKDRSSLGSVSFGNGDATVQIVKVDYVNFEVDKVDDDTTLAAAPTSSFRSSNCSRISFDDEVDNIDDKDWSAHPTKVVWSRESSSPTSVRATSKDSLSANTYIAGCASTRTFGMTKKGQPCKVCIRQQNFCKYHISQNI